MIPGELFIVKLTHTDVDLWDCEGDPDTICGALQTDDIVILLEAEMWNTWGHLVLTKCGPGRVATHRLERLQ